MQHGDVDSVLWNMIAMHDPLTVAGVIRKLSTADEPLYLQHLLRLDADTRRERFGGAVADARIAAHALDALSGTAIVHGFFVEGAMRGSAEMRLTSVSGRDQADVVFSIERAYRGCGVGSALLGRSLLAARKRHVGALRTRGLPASEPIQALARRMDGDLSALIRAGDSVATPGSTLAQWRDLLADGRNSATALLETSLRALTAGRA